MNHDKIDIDLVTKSSSSTRPSADAEDTNLLVCGDLIVFHVETSELY